MEAVDAEKSERGIVDREDGRVRAAHLGALILLGAAVTAAPHVTRSYGLAAFVALYAVAAAAWLVLRTARASLFVVVVIALALRVPLAIAPPVLSGDVYRYLWDGRLLSSGVNPYGGAPSDPRLTPFREWWHERINHPDIPTLYPPHAEILFAVAHRLPLWRLLIIAAEVAILFLLRRRPDVLLAWATFPLLLFEGSWSGHVDVVAGLFLLIAVTGGSGTALGVAAGIKLIPFAALPALAMRSSRPVRFIAAAAAAFTIPFIPFTLAGRVMPGLRDYAMRWIFNSPLYEVVFHVVDRAGLAPLISPRLYSDLLTRVVLALLAVVAVAVLVVRRAPVSASIAALLLCSPAIHPWYWLVVAPLAMLERTRTIVLLALLAPASYLLYAGGAKWIVAMICYAPLVTARLRLSAIAPSVAEERPAAIPPRTGHGTSPS